MGNTAGVVQTDSHRVITESLYILAKLSSNVYDLDNGYNEKKLNEDVGSYRIIKDSVRNCGVLCSMAVWKNDHNGVKILAVKGTSTAGDVKKDIDMVLGGASSFSIVPTLNQATNLISQYGVHLVTGHSLGGYVAEILATKGKICGASFCGPGVNGPVVRLGGTETAGFQNIQFETDYIGNFNCAAYTHVQWSVYVATPDGGSCHAIDEMVNYFKNKTHINNANVVKCSESCNTGYYYPK